MPGRVKANLSDQPGSSKAEIEDEPDWGSGHNHRIGFRNNQNRVPGLTHDGDWWEDQEDAEFVDGAMQKYRQLRQRAEKGELLNFQDIGRQQTDFHLRRPEFYPPGWRFVIRTTEDFVKQEQDWPANIKARQKKEEQEKKKQEEEQQQEREDTDDEDNWRRDREGGSAKHNDAYGKSHQSNGRDSQSEEQQDGEKSGDQGRPDGKQQEQKSEYQKLREKYSPQEITLLQHLQDQQQYEKSMKQSDGKVPSPLAQQEREHYPIEIDTIDASTPDNWIPRSRDLIRNTGQHPLNAEPQLSSLFEAGLTTPNAIHYVRNHAAVPRLFWDTHILDIADGKLRLGMDELRKRFDPINIQVALGCDGNRRGELNLIKKSKGFNWGSGAISCAYWKGARLSDVLDAAGVPRVGEGDQRLWVNFEGSDELSEGKYATSVPLEYAMDPCNDVILAYEMNDVPLPPDHGYPVRLLIPGYVGGRCVKWLARIWISEEENDSYYHIWDNRVLPSFITEKDGDFARTMFNHPSTACNEQNLNSIICRPAQGEKIMIKDILQKDTYRVQGIAYDGGGNEVQRVELSLDEGRTWLYCIRRFPDRPIRHGKKFWTWLHWYVDVDTAHLVQAHSLIVRCFNVFKNTQPEIPVWNTMGMMNNGWYRVKPVVEESGILVFHHPVDIEGDGGWMKPSTENQLAAAKQDTGVPDKQFTRQQIEKHYSQDDCWLVINDKVYDATSVLDWQPRGKATILTYAGQLSSEVTQSFESIHDEYARKKLQECVIGRITDKASNFLKEKVKKAAEEAAESKAGQSKTLLQKQSWTMVELKERKQLSEDTFAYTFQIPGGKKALGLGTCQHIQFGIHMRDKMLVRSYTPTRPILEKGEDGTFELTIKTYYPNENQPGGAFSNLLYVLPIGESVEVCGPTGEIEYLGSSKFRIEGKDMTFSKVSLIVGGSGLTPAYQLIVKILENSDKDKTELRVIDANKTEDDILLKAKLDELAKKHAKQFKITHVLSHPKSDGWGGLKGHVNADIIRGNCFAPNEDGACVFLCGPPAMIQKAALPALKDWGYKEEENCFGF